MFVPRQSGDSSCNAKHVLFVGLYLRYTNNDHDVAKILVFLIINYIMTIIFYYLWLSCWLIISYFICILFIFFWYNHHCSVNALLLLYYSSVFFFLLFLLRISTNFQSANVNLSNNVNFLKM